MLDRFPDELFRNGNKVLEFKPFEAAESEIVRQLSFRWRKVE